jgi:hypothetical protein
MWALTAATAATAAGWPKRDAILAPLNPFAACQFENQRLLERRRGVEVERVEILGLWKPRRPDAEMA